MSGAVALVLGLLLQDLATLDTLPDGFTPAELSAHPAVRRLVAGHRTSLPELTSALASTSWKARLGAAFALKNLGLTEPLRKAIDDPDARVRDFVRAVLVRPPEDPRAERLPPAYSRDERTRAFSDALVRADAALEDVEKRARMRAVVADLLDKERSPEEGRAALDLARRDLPRAWELLAESAGTAPPGPFFGALSRLLSLGRPAAIPETLKGAIDAGIAHPDPEVRSLALTASRALPEDERSAKAGRALLDPDPQVRQEAVQATLDLLREANGQGEPAKEDLHLARLKAFLDGEKDEGTLAALRERILEKTEEILDERRRLQEGDDDGGTRQRYLKAGRALIAVSAREYEMCLARGRGPYIAEEDFRVLRAEANLELSARAAIPAVAPPPPKDVARPKAEALRTPARSTPSAPPGSAGRRGAWILLGAVAIALTLGVLLWRARA